MKINTSKNTGIPYRRTLAVTVVALLTVGAVWKMSSPAKSQDSAHAASVLTTDKVPIPNYEMTEEQLAPIIKSFEANGLFDHGITGTPLEFGKALFHTIEGADQKYGEAFIKTFVKGWKASEGWKDHSSKHELDEEAFTSFWSTFVAFHYMEDLKTEDEKKMQHTIRVIAYAALHNWADNLYSLLSTGTFFFYDKHEARKVTSKDMSEETDQFAKWFAEWNQGMLEFIHGGDDDGTTGEDNTGDGTTGEASTGD